MQDIKHIYINNNRKKRTIKNIKKIKWNSRIPKNKRIRIRLFQHRPQQYIYTAALGMARARDLKGENNSVLAVIGDGALTGGMALEALNDAGYSQSKLTVILNDNEMSISKNIGGLNMLLR